MKRYAILPLVLLLASLSYGATVILNGANIQDSTVTNAKLIDNNVNGGKILDNTITSAKIQDNAVAVGKIATNAVTNVKILDNTIDPTTKLAHTGTPDNTTLLRGDKKWQPILSVCNLSKTDNQAVATGNTDNVTFQQEDSDTLNAHTSADNIVVTIPSGYSWVNASVWMKYGQMNEGNTAVVVSIWQNSSLLSSSAVNGYAWAAASPGPSVFAGTRWVPCVPGDKIYVTVYSNVAAGIAVQNTSWFRVEFK